MPVAYEVNLTVDSEIAAEYRVWLTAYVQETLALPGFRSARILEDAAGENHARETSFCTQYELEDQAALDQYLRVHAGRMRADGMTRFGDRFRASGRVLRSASGY